jgi:hypothetical protein
MTGMATTHKRLPTGAQREALRAKGQFWTPPWVAEAMVAYPVAAGAAVIFDPAVGAGAFFLAARKVAAEMGRDVRCVGAELDAQALVEARRNGVPETDLAGVAIRDFVQDHPQGMFEAIVANPPYIRHHRLSSTVKAFLRRFCVSLIGRPLDGRAGLHVYFLLRALQLLQPDGRLAFIVPADTCEGVFARPLWDWITSRYCLEGVVTFSPDASPFPGVDTNPLILMIRNGRPRKEFLWARCSQSETNALKAWVLSGFADAAGDGLVVRKRDLAEALQTGLSREPTSRSTRGAVLADYATVLRGIATGDNEFFHLTAARAAELGIPQAFLTPAIGRTRDVTGDEVDSDTFSGLEASGRPTLLFSPDGRPLNAFPETVQAYLRQGEKEGIPKKPLLSTRRPWYKMERRDPPPILFAYLGRRNARFVRNRAGVVSLTCLLCVYPRENDPAHVEKLWQVLRHPATIANLVLVGKSYGGGAIKVEPRALESLPLPTSVVAEVGLSSPRRPEQAQLSFESC